MNATIENIDYLIVQKLAGTADDEELKQFEELIASDQLALKRWRTALENNSEENLQNNFKRMEDRDWQDADTLKNNGKRNRRSVIVARLSLAVAAAVIIAFTAILFSSINNSPKHREMAGQPGQQSSANERNIELKLASGELIDLSHQSGKLLFGRTTFLNNDRGLTFTTNKEDTLLNSMSTLIVPPGHDYYIVLSDGTQVWLNAQTTLQFPLSFSGHTREISIEGEAYLEVAKDAQKPFVVHTGKEAVQVLGTSFNINCYQDDAVTVSLVDGSVKLVTQKGEKKLQPGYEIIAQNGNMSVQPFEKDIVLAWREGKYYFNNTAFADIATVLQRGYGRDIIFDNDEIKLQRFTGMVNRKKSIESFLNKIKVAANLDYYYDENRRLHLR